MLIQYSVSEKWGAKITKTHTRISTTFPDATILIYMSNQTIGAKADQLKKDLRKTRGISLDIRDSSWFTDRVHSSVACEKASEDLATAIVDPYLANRGVSSAIPTPLSNPEQTAALTFLGLQWRDDNRDKGLTKLAFDALVRSVLADTNSTARLSRLEVHERVSKILHAHDKDTVGARVDSALRRLSKGAIRHWKAEDEFCLSHEDADRTQDYKTNSSLADGKLVASISTIAGNMLAPHPKASKRRAAFADCIRSATDMALLERSQAFCLAVQTGTMKELFGPDLDNALIEELSRARLPRIKGVDWLSLLRQGVQEVLLSDEEAIQAYLKSLSDAYTLLAFLKQTPDVQRASRKMFSQGRICPPSAVVGTRNRAERR